MTPPTIPGRAADGAVLPFPHPVGDESVLFHVLGQTTGTAPGTGGMSAFLGFTVLVLTGFLVLARLSQRVVDDAEEAADGERVRVPASPGPAPAPADVDAGSESKPGVGRDDRPGGRSVDPDGAEDAAPPGRHRYDPDEDTTSRDVETGSSARSLDATTPPGTEHGAADERDRASSAGTGRSVPTGGRDGSGEASIPPAALLANVALTQGLFGGVLAAAAWFFQVPGTALGLEGARVAGLTAASVGLAFGVALWVGNELAGALADATGAGYDEGLRQLLAPAEARGWAVLLGGVLPVIALVEEFLFRAAAVGAASAWLGGAPAVAWALAVGSSLAFALGHGAQGRVGVVVTGALGFALAAGFLVSGSFVVVAVAHYVVNALEFLVHEGAGLPDPVWA